MFKAKSASRGVSGVIHVTVGTDLVLGSRDYREIFLKLVRSKKMEITQVTTWHNVTPREYRECTKYLEMAVANNDTRVNIHELLPNAHINNFTAMQLNSAVESEILNQNTRVINIFAKCNGAKVQISLIVNSHNSVIDLSLGRMREGYGALADSVVNVLNKVS